MYTSNFIDSICPEEEQQEGVHKTHIVQMTHIINSVTELHARSRNGFGASSPYSGHARTSRPHARSDSKPDGEECNSVACKVQEMGAWTS